MGVLAARSPRTGRREPVVVEAFHRGLDVFRPIAVVYAALLTWLRHDEMVRPWAAVVTLAVMGGWSLGLLVYRRRSRRVVVAEVVIAVGAILMTPLADGAAAVAAGQYTLPTVWAAGSVAGAAVVAGARGGLLAAGAVAVADLVEIAGRPTQGTVHNIVILVLLGGLIGLAVDLARSGLEREEQVLLERERLRERERIARVVHDGVLQTLAYVHRRGIELGGEAEELATLAADQERALRRFVSGAGAPGDAVDLHGAEGAEVDLRVSATAHERPGVTVSVPRTRSSSTPRSPASSVRPWPPSSTTSPGTRGRVPGRGSSSRATRRGSSSRCATTGSGPTPSSCRRRPGAGGWASAPPSAGGSRTSAVPPRGRPARGQDAPCASPSRADPRSEHDRRREHTGRAGHVVPARPRRRRPPAVARGPRARPRRPRGGGRRHRERRAGGRASYPRHPPRRPRPRPQPAGDARRRGVPGARRPPDARAHPLGERRAAGRPGRDQGGRQRLPREVGVPRRDPRGRARDRTRRGGVHTGAGRPRPRGVPPAAQRARGAPRRRPGGSGPSPSSRHARPRCCGSSRRG